MEANEPVQALLRSFRVEELADEQQRADCADLLKKYVVEVATKQAWFAGFRAGCRITERIMPEETERLLKLQTELRAALDEKRTAVYLWGNCLYVVADSADEARKQAAPGIAAYPMLANIVATQEPHVFKAPTMLFLAEHSPDMKAKAVVLSGE